MKNNTKSKKSGKKSSTSSKALKKGVSSSQNNSKSKIDFLTSLKSISKIRLSTKLSFRLAFIGALLLIFIVSYINIFPDGYIFSGADVQQRYNLPHIIRVLSYTWIPHGMGYFLQYYSWIVYYSFIHLFVEIFSLSVSQQSIMYYLIFFTSSFFGFYSALNIYESKKASVEQKLYFILFSLIYTFNPYTFYLFYYTWGFSPIPLLYVLLPPLFACVYSFFKDDSNTFKNLSKIGVVGLLLNIPNGNLPFYIYLNIILAIFVLYLFLLTKTKFNFIKRTVGLYIVLTFTTFFSVVPQLYEMLNLVNTFDTGVATSDMRDWLYWQATPLSDSFFLVFDIKQYIEQLSPLTFLFSLFFISFIYLSVQWKERVRDKDKELFVGFVLLLVVTFILLNKGKGILSEESIWILFKTPLLSSLRSYDKVLIGLPFLLLSLVYLLTKNKFSNNKIILLVFTFLNFISIYPLFTGKMQTEYSVAFDSQKNQNYQNANYRYIHKIPEEYFESADVINKDIGDYNILRAPYSVLNSVGWVNYPKWQLVGVDPTSQLFNSNSIQMNNYGVLDNWNYGLVWNSYDVEDSLWLLRLAGHLNARYLIYHKDVDKMFIDRTRAKISYYLTTGDITEVINNEYFEIYKLNEKYFLPHIYSPTEVVYLLSDTLSLDDIHSLSGFDQRTMYYVTNKKPDSKLLELTSSYITTGRPLNIDYIWNKNWYWPKETSKYSLLSKYTDDQLLNSSEDTYDFIEKNLFLGAKSTVTLSNSKRRLTTNKKLFESAFSNYKQAIDNLKKINQYGEVTFTDKEFWTIAAKIKLYNDRSILLMESKGVRSEWINQLNALSKEYNSWLSSITSECSHKTCFSFITPKNGSYELYNKLGYNNWEKLSNHTLNSPYTVISTNNIEKKYFTRDQINASDFPLEIKLENWPTSTPFAISLDYSSNVNFKITVHEDIPGRLVDLRLKDNPAVRVKTYETTLVANPCTGSDDCKDTISVNYKSNSESINGYISFAIQNPQVLKQEVSISNFKVTTLPKNELLLESKVTNPIVSTPNIEFFRVNPTKYKVKVTNATSEFPLVFSEKFNPGWKIYNTSALNPEDANRLVLYTYFDNSVVERSHSMSFLDASTFETMFIKPLEVPHLEVNGFANGWIIDPSKIANSNSFELTIEFEPQKLYYIGAIISLLSGFIVSSIFIYTHLRRVK